MKKLVWSVLLAATAAHATPAGRVAGSKHDFSSSGPGAYRAVSEGNPCTFCHVAHAGGDYVLSNRPDTGTRHRPYESSTMRGRAPVPEGSSRMCLSCHDGTIAVGSTRRGPIQLVGGNRPIPAGDRSNLGTDLRGSHPVSLHPSPEDGTRVPRPGDPVKLDAAGRIQCTSCHDPHAEWGDPKRGKFLVEPNDRSRLCTTCHPGVAGAGASSHFSSPASAMAADGRSTTVAELGCEACHESHGADVRGRLLRKGADDDTTCLSCHGGSVARLNVAAEVRKPWAHASSGRGVHDAAERPNGVGRRVPEASPGTPRHVACVDCHDPHSATSTRATAPAAGGALAGTWGIDMDGQAVEPARFEYEVCLKCHGDSANKPMAGGTGSGHVRRAVPDTNLRRVFAASSPSFHPVAAPGRNPLVPSLRAPYSPATMIYCTDCHASDAGGGAAPRGPHGSIYPSMLEREYLTADLVPESPASYALCYKCHDRDVLLSRASGFPLHRRHVLDSSAPCSACHDAHGVSSEAGNERENAHLVSFDLSIVRPLRGAPRYLSAGPSTGSCNLLCHGRAHDEQTGRY